MRIPEIPNEEALTQQGRRPRLLPVLSRQGEGPEVIGGYLAIIPDNPLPDSGIHWQIAPTGTINFVDSLKGTVISPATVIQVSLK